MKKHLTIIVAGRVQGVGFRAGTRHTAIKLGLAGWAQNEPDGTVHIVIEGEEKAVIQFLSWVRKGTFLSDVKDIQTEEGKLEYLTDFHIRKHA